MEINRIKTDSEGLKKLVDFINSEENLFHIDAEKPSDNRVFCIEHVNYRRSAIPGTEPSYAVDIKTEFEADNSKYLNFLLDLIKEVYRV